MRALRLSIGAWMFVCITAGDESLTQLTIALDKLVLPREAKPAWRGTDVEYAQLPVQDALKSVRKDLCLSFVFSVVFQISFMPGHQTVRCER